jgi:hypothetical protein
MVAPRSVSVQILGSPLAWTLRWFSISWQLDKRASGRDT